MTSKIRTGAGGAIDEVILCAGRKAKVSNAKISPDIDEQVLGLQIAVDDIESVNVIQPFYDLSQQLPASIDRVRNSMPEQISKRLSFVSARSPLLGSDTDPVLTELHLDV